MNHLKIKNSSLHGLACPAKLAERSRVPLCEKKSQRGAALVITLLVVSVLTMIVIGFMVSMSTERLTADSYSALTQAELAADAGTADAAQLVVNALLDNPWHGIGVKYVPENDPAANPPQQRPTVLFGGRDTTATPTNEVFLLSYNSTLGAFDNTNSADLNFQRNTADQVGWIGSKIDIENASVIREPARAHWIELLRDPSSPEQPDPKTANYNPVVARYAFWIEDETSKLDYSVSGNSSGGGSFQRSIDSNTPDDLDLGAIPLTSLSPLDYPNADANSINSDLVNFQNANYAAFEDPRVLNQASNAFPASPEDIADSVKFHATAFSLSNDLSMTGRRRANLNAIVTNTTDPDEIAADINDIAYVITGQHVMLLSPDGGTGAHPSLDNSTHNGIFLDQPEILDQNDPNFYAPLPEFGERFYSGNASGINQSLKRDIYLKKIAANIRDYIDTNSQPTFIDPTGTVPGPARPAFAPSITQPKPQAIGKEAVPYLQEHAWRGYIIPGSWSALGSQSSAVITADLRFDHYFELYNPTTKDYTAATGTFIKIYNQPRWLGGTAFPDLIPGDFEIDISGVNVPAGDVRVITTNDTGQHPPGLLRDISKLVARTASPTSSILIPGAQTNEKISNVTGFQLSGRSSSITDYQTEFLLGSNQGIIDYFPAISVSLSSSSPWNITSRGSNLYSQTRFVYSSSLRGNDRPSRTGDARSLSEQLLWKDYQSGGNGDQSRFYGNIQGHGDSSSPNIPDTSTFGWARTQYVAPSNWPDYHVSLNDTAVTAPAAFRDSVLVSIGELGQIYDPSRRISTENGSDISHARGGGRSLKIGQQDDVVASTRFGTTGGTTEWFNAAWRLCDLFSAENAADPVSSPSSRGRININGALRDNGVAIRAALREFVFLQAPDGDAARAGRAITDQELDDLVDEIIAYLETNGPMLERGELSQLEFFAGAGSDQRAGGQRGSTSIDRGREEIFRRVVELITTRSFSFSIYSLAEAVRQFPNGDLRMEARSAKRTVIHLVPETDDGGTIIDLGNSTDFAATPTSFRIEKVHESRLF